MTDDATSNATVKDDELGSSEDRDDRPLSSTIRPSPQNGGGLSFWKSSNLAQSSRQARPNETRECCTNVVHNHSSDDELRRCSEKASRHSDCCTKLVHKPSERPSSPSRRSAARSRHPQSGLIVRGRVFYVRLRVPRSLEKTVGRTHWTKLHWSRRFGELHWMKLHWSSSANPMDEILLNGPSEG